MPIRWVLVRDPAGVRNPQAFLCTDLNATPATILGWYVQRWSMETTFQDTREHLGIETQRQWSDRAIATVRRVLWTTRIYRSGRELAASPRFEFWRLIFPKARRGKQRLSDVESLIFVRPERQPAAGQLRPRMVQIWLLASDRISAICRPNPRGSCSDPHYS